MHKDSQLESLKGRDHLGEQGIGGRAIIEHILKKWVRVWTGFEWLRIGSSGRFL
jgi:hypothetical protein